jgi:AraC-like DNA-binding protein
MKLNQVHIEKDYGWFLGKFDQNKLHRHYAIQISIPLQDALSVHTSNKSFTTRLPVLIQSNVPHRLAINSMHFLLLINPASTIGHYWKTSTSDSISQCILPPAKQLQETFSRFSGNKSKSIESIDAIIQAYDCYCQSSVHSGDERINSALEYLQIHQSRSISMQEVADHCHLSKERFRHLFKQQTGITYRRAQLWIKIVQSMRMIGRSSFTEIAHNVGFSDSAHFSRTFRENFGFSPRDFVKNSRFVQV